MLESRHLRRDEDGQIADVRIGEMHNLAADRFQILGVHVDLRDPAEGLVRRGDVVAPVGEGGVVTGL